MSNEIWNNDERPGGVFGITTVQTPRVLLEADNALETERVAAPQAEEAGQIEGGHRDPSRTRRALRRLQNGPPSEFEQIIDLLYEWREHSPRAQVTEVMRTLMTRNHNMDDRSSIKMMRNLIQEARKAKIDEAIAKLGLDEAERVLGLKPEEDK